jgi:hypothetical protein
MTDRVLLTDTRKDLLEGDYDSSNPTHRNRKHRLKESSKTALDELIQIAQSPIIDNTEIFETEQVARLTRALLTPDVVHTEGGGLWPGTEDLPDELTVTVSDEYQQYQDRLYVVLDDPMHSYRDSRFPDPGE